MARYKFQLQRWKANKLIMVSKTWYIPDTDEKTIDKAYEEFNMGLHGTWYFLEDGPTQEEIDRLPGGHGDFHSVEQVNA